MKRFHFCLLGTIQEIECALDRKIASYRQLAFSMSTRRSYSSQLNSYLTFCNKMQYQPVPAHAETIVRYTAYLAERLSPQSIPSYLNVVRLVHLESNFPNPMENNFTLDMLLKGIKREKGIIVKKSSSYHTSSVIKISVNS